jgi:hypothetical protein
MNFNAIRRVSAIARARAIRPEIARNAQEAASHARVDLLAMGGAKGALETKNLLEMCQ